MFRAVVKEVLVRPLDARLDGVVITDEEKQRKFDAIRHDFESRTGEFKNYEADVATLFRKIRERLMVHTKANIWGDWAGDGAGDYDWVWENVANVWGDWAGDRGGDWVSKANEKKKDSS